MTTKKTKPSGQQQLALKRRKVSVKPYVRDYPERLPPRDENGRWRKRKKRA